MASDVHFGGAGLAGPLFGDGVDVGRAAGRASGRPHRPVIAFVGMAFEARIAAGPGVHVFSRDLRRELAVAAASAARHGYRGIISFGVAGGLQAGLRPGDWIVASAIVGAHQSRPTDTVWSKNLLAAIGGAHHVPIAGVDTPIADPGKKRELHRATGAAAVDMESHVVADLAAAHGLAFTALRVIVDPAHRAIPSAALKGMGAGARADGAAVLRDLAARPAQLTGLMRISFDAYIARSEMVRVRRLLHPHFGLADAVRAEAAAIDLPTAEATPFGSSA